MVAPGLITVLGPRDNGLVRGDSVRVAVRLKPRARGFEARLNTRDVTSRFKSSGDGVRVARISRGKILRYGLNSLTIEAQNATGASDFVGRSFTLARRTPGLLSAPNAVSNIVSGRQNLSLIFRDPRALVRIYLNGRRIDNPLADYGRRRSMPVDADEGLRFGRNDLALVAFVPDRGTYDTESHVFQVARRAPIPSAGPDHLVRIGETVQLTGARSIPTGKRSKLEYRWKIVDKPAGSLLSFDGSSTETPTLTPEVPGQYRVRLKLIETPRGRSAKRATLSAVDDVLVSATPGAPIGVPIQTIARSGGGVGVSLGAPCNVTYPAQPGAALQMVALDRTTLECPQPGQPGAVNNSYLGTDADTQKLENDVGNLGNSSLVIITSPADGAIAPVADQAALNNLNAALKTIGAESLPANVATTATPCPQQTGICSNFSAIGVPGMLDVNNNPVCCPADINPGLTLISNDGSTHTGLAGYLQAPTSGGFTFVSGDYVQYDTTAAGSGPGQVAVSIGDCDSIPVPSNAPPAPCKLYQSDDLGPVVPGFYVLVLDSGSLGLRDQGTFTVAQSSFMAELLAKYSSDPSALVFVQSIGGPVPQEDPGWDATAAQLELLGGSSYYFTNLFGPTAGQSTGFAQVGIPGKAMSPYTRVASQASAAPAGTTITGQLSGALARNPQSRFYPQNATPRDDQDSSLSSTVYRPEIPWPYRTDTPGHHYVAAQGCLLAALNLTISSKLISPIEANYSANRQGYDWSTLSGRVAALSYASLPQTAACTTPTFTEIDFNTVRDQVSLELADLGQLNLLTANLKAPFDALLASGPTGFEAIASQIAANIPHPGDPEGESDPLDIASDLLLLFASIPDNPAAEAGDAISAILGLVGDFETTPSGGPTFESDLFIQVSQYANRLEGLYQSALNQFDHFGDIIASDWGKLSVTAYKTGTNHPWSWPEGTTANLVSGLTVAAERNAYTTLFPTGFDLYRVPPAVGTNITQLHCVDQEATKKTPLIYPFKSAPPLDTTFVAETAVTPTQMPWVYALPDGDDPNQLSSDTYFNSYEVWHGSYGEQTTPTGALINAMFGGTSPPLVPLAFPVEAYDLGNQNSVTVTGEPITVTKDSRGVCNG